MYTILLFSISPCLKVRRFRRFFHQFLNWTMCRIGWVSEWTGQENSMVLLFFCLLSLTRQSNAVFSTSWFLSNWHLQPYRSRIIVGGSPISWQIASLLMLSLAKGVEQVSRPSLLSSGIFFLRYWWCTVLGVCSSLPTQKVACPNLIVTNPERSALRSQLRWAYAISSGWLSGMIGKPWLRVTAKRPWVL